MIRISRILIILIAAIILCVTCSALAEEDTEYYDYWGKSHEWSLIHYSDKETVIDFEDVLGTIYIDWEKNTWLLNITDSRLGGPTEYSGNWKHDMYYILELENDKSMALIEYPLLSLECEAPSSCAISYFNA